MTKARPSAFYQGAARLRPVTLTALAATLSISLLATTMPARAASAAPSPPARAAEAAALAHLSLPATKRGHSRPLVVIVGDSAGAETTDFIIPYGVLKDSGVADVRALGTAPGPVQLMRVIKIQPDDTTAEFDATTPEGADIVIVPAQMNPDSPKLSAWLSGQFAKGATIVSICEGAIVLAKAGLLKGRRATTHWASLDDLEKKYPDTTWVRDRRYVQDGRIISTTGVSASIPVSLALVEAIGGHDIAAATAKRMGVTDWSDAHRTEDFKLTTGDYAHAIWSMAAFWDHESLELPIANGTDEVALALRSDTWLRSFRTTVVTTNRERKAIHSQHGLVILPDAQPQSGHFVIQPDASPPATQLDATLKAMTDRYGKSTARLAWLGMEYSPSSDAIMH